MSPNRILGAGTSSPVRRSPHATFGALSATEPVRGGENSYRGRSGSRFSIAMGTYNGERFIREQLDSLANQSLLPCELVVRDDSSSDRTVQIVEEFAKTAPFPVRIYASDTRRGYPDNFIHAAQLTTEDWIAFCDQDDVWFRSKLERVAAAITQDSRVVLVVHSAELVTEDLSPTGRRFPDIKRPLIIGQLRHPSMRHYPGFCCTFSRGLVEDVRWDVEDPRNSPHSHDSWISFLANTLGNTYYVPDSLVLFRRHHLTVTGDYGRVTFSTTLAQARRAGSEGYRKSAEVISGYASLLETRAAENRVPDISNQLRKGAAYYARFAGSIETRARLYEAPNFLARVAVFVSLLAGGAYLGRSRLVLGGRALVKDLIVTLLGSSRITHPCAQGQL
jgi:glycosyltransferase involved in cell wall biosynthesis